MSQGLVWRRLGQSAVIYAYGDVQHGRVWIYCRNERTGAVWEKLCSQPARAPGWVAEFARQNP